MKRKELPKQWIGYAVTAGAFLAVGPAAHAAYHQTLCTGDCTLDTLGECISIDIDGGGTPDFNICVHSSYTTSYTYTYNIGVLIYPVPGNQIALDPDPPCCWGYGKALRYAPGATGVTSSAAAWQPSTATLHTSFGCGNFRDQAGVIAVKFQIGVDTRLGWINYSGNGDDTGTIISWGYVDDPSEGYNYPTNPLLVDLISFTAAPGPDSIGLAWETASEIDNAGFHVWRSENRDWGYQRITDSLIPARGGPTQGAAYAFVDKTATPGKTWFYKLEDVDTAGNSVYHQVVSAWPGVVNIEVNGADGPATVPASDPVSVKVSVRPEEGASARQEWWLCCESPFGWFSYVNPKGWVPGTQPAWVNPQVPIENLEVLNGALPPGDYTFHFALDSRVDGRPPAPLFTQQIEPLDRLFLNSQYTTPTGLQQISRWQRAVPNWLDSVELRVE